MLSISYLEWTSLVTTSGPRLVVYLSTDLRRMIKTVVVCLLLLPHFTACLAGWLINTRNCRELIVTDHWEDLSFSIQPWDGQSDTAQLQYLSLDIMREVHSRGMSFLSLVLYGIRINIISKSNILCEE